MPRIILGPPGTGKTTTLLGMVEAELARGTPPDRIGYVSFTKRAAEEATQRACERFNLKRADFPYFRTLHSLCFKQMGLTRGDVLEGDKLEEFGDYVGAKISRRFSMEEGITFGFERGDRLIFMENLARVRCIPLRQQYDEFDDNQSWFELDRFSRSLVDFKADRGLIDYTDMLDQFARASWSPTLDVLFVDEAQDLSQLQWRVVQKLMQSARETIFAGDDDQAIYRWAGADVEHWINLEGDVQVLGQSWRVPRSVQARAAEVIGRVKHRRPKQWSPRDAEGLVQSHRDFDDVDISGEDILVLGRNRMVLDRVEQNIRSAGYLYEYQGRQSIKPSTLDAVMTWERLRQGKGEVTAKQAVKMYDLMSLKTRVARGHKKLPAFQPDEVITMQSLLEKGGLACSPEMLWYDALDRLPMQEVAYIRAARRRGEDFRKAPRIRLSTIHGIKGGEGRQVILMTDMATRTHEEMGLSPEDEARVWYVAVTRAKEELHIISPRTARYYDL